MIPHEIIGAQVKTIFPQADIETISKFSGGLVSKVYRVEIKNPEKVLAVKIFPNKMESDVIKSMQISNYLRENNLPASHVYGVTTGDTEGVAVMDCASGCSAAEAWESSSINEKELILENTGAILKKIHGLPIPAFWVHKKHEVRSPKEWLAWTEIRIQKYLTFAEETLSEEISLFLKKRFDRLLTLYSMYPNFDLEPLHWDYHFGNINIDDKKSVTGVFDFDNTMKGHAVADIGQFMYWIIRMQKADISLLEKFFIGYGGLSEIDREFVQLHFLLFLSATTRSVWPKDDLRWLSKLHVELLDECVRGKHELV